MTVLSYDSEYKLSPESCVCVCVRVRAESWAGPGNGASSDELDCVELDIKHFLWLFQE